MPDRVLVGLDGSEQSETALAYAVDTFPAATIVGLHAIDPFDADPEGADTEPLTEPWLADERERARELFDRTLEAVDVDEDRLEWETTVGSPAESIVAYAEQEPIDGIVVGSYGIGEASHLQLGSVSELVVRRAPVPVTVVR